ncbi:hypothetical protein HPB47_013341 [Ixodes persulcatus]|uniref:Uncharacterized protein n=1 Tax=Ixodes persulcatus TaxID=34615 RepID=A0AC60QYX3_IXOPE|nr:hypothetical protein HPB47_013341 [Ixodes persulcatus]
MAATIVSPVKVVFVLAFCLAVIGTCTNPGANDPSHVVTATAQYNPTTKKCETIPSETGPHNCQKFATIADCQKNCAIAKDCTVC